MQRLDAGFELVREGRFADAASLYQRVHEQTGELRARNHAIAALVRAEAGEAPN